MLSLVQYLELYLEGYNELKDRDKRLVLILLTSRNNKHAIWPGARSFNRQWLKHGKVGADDKRFNRVNNKCNLFYTNGSFKVGAYSKPWWLTESTRNVMVGYALQCDPQEIMQMLEANNVHMDLFAVRDFMYSEATPDQVMECCTLIGACNEGHFVETEYKTMPCGRIVAIGNYNIQHMPGWLRDVALHGWWDYDFQNCHYVIANTFGDFPAIDDYVQNPKNTRQRLSSVTGSDEKSVKYALLSKLYGAKNNPSGYCAIGQYLGVDGANALFEDEFYKQLEKDIERLKPILLGKAKDFPEIQGKDESVCSQVLMVWESHLLDLATKGMEDIIPMFDGFLSRERRDAKDIQRRLRQQTHIPIVVIEKKIGGV